MEEGKDRAGSRRWGKGEEGVWTVWRMERKKTEEGMGGGGGDEWRAGARKRGGREGGGREMGKKKRKKMKQSGQIRFGVEGSEQGDYSN